MMWVLFLNIYERAKEIGQRMSWLNIAVKSALSIAVVNQVLNNHGT